VPLEPPLRAGLEARSLRASFALAEMRFRLEALARQASLTRTEGWLPDVAVDVHALQGEPERRQGDRLHSRQSRRSGSYDRAFELAQRLVVAPEPRQRERVAGQRLGCAGSLAQSERLQQRQRPCGIADRQVSAFEAGYNEGQKH
jgi:hypothetical protein